MLSLNGFLASTEGSDMAPEGMDYLSLEPYDVYWSRVRDMYSPFENGMKSGTARVFDHQIPGEFGRDPRVMQGVSKAGCTESLLQGSRVWWVRRKMKIVQFCPRICIVALSCLVHSCVLDVLGFCVQVDSTRT